MRSSTKTDSRISVHDNADFLGVMENHNLAWSVISPGSQHTRVVSVNDFLMPECLEWVAGMAEGHRSVGMVGR